MKRFNHLSLILVVCILVVLVINSIASLHDEELFEDTLINNQIVVTSAPGYDDDDID